MKSIFSKLNFALALNPKVEKLSEWKRYIPAPYNAVVTITADFELAWAWRYSKTVTNSLELALKKARLERRNVPIILELCEKYNIPVTWATVGHLFMVECNKENNTPHLEMPRLNRFENEYWGFSGSDWFEYDPCSNYKDAPEWYSPDLIDQILSSRVGHEIGCHTFSHIDCRDEVCPKEVFDAELNLCNELASAKGVKLSSFVHPGHTIGNLRNLAELGFTSFQTDPGNILGYPVKHDNGLWELKRTYEFGWREGWSVDYHIYRYKKIIDRAIKSNTVCNFWFHPSFDPIFVEEIMPSLLAHISERSEEIMPSTVSDYISRLENV